MSENRQAAYVERLKAKLGVWSERFEALHDNALNARFRDSRDLERRLRELRKARDEVLCRLDEVDDSDAEAWEGLRMAVEDAVHKLEAGLASVIKDLKSGSSDR